MFLKIFADFSFDKQIGFQDPATPIMEGIIDLHHYIFFFLVIICIFVIWIMLAILYRFWFQRFIYTRQNFINGGYTSIKLYLWAIFMSNMAFFNKLKAIRFIFSFNGWRYIFSNIFDSPTFSYLRRKSHKYRSEVPMYHFRIYKLIGSQAEQRLRRYYQLILYLRVLNRRRFLDLLKETRIINHGVMLEIIWTILPSFILIFIAIPSFILLYSIDEIAISCDSLILKAIGNQWFWTYEISIPDNNFVNNMGVNFFKNTSLEINNNITFDSYMISTDDLITGDLRLLAVDRELFIPIVTHVKILVTSRDVLHSWAIPSLGIKVDAVPGRINACSAFIQRSGTFYGQCSEICGINHAFMPIVIKTMDQYAFSVFERFMYYYL